MRCFLVRSNWERHAQVTCRYSDGTVAIPSSSTDHHIEDGVLSLRPVTAILSSKSVAVAPGAIDNGRTWCASSNLVHLLERQESSVRIHDEAEALHEADYRARRVAEAKQADRQDTFGHSRSRCPTRLKRTAGTTCVPVTSILRDRNLAEPSARVE
jgi:hypothetical protein